MYLIAAKAINTLARCIFGGGFKYKVHRSINGRVKK
jgi:hypothetical protein